MEHHSTTPTEAVWFPGLPGALRGALLAGVAVGVLALLYGVATGAYNRVGQAFLVNFLFWTGVSQAGVIFSAAYRLCNGSWGEPFRRIGETMGAFLPVSAVLFVLVLPLGGSIYPWVREPVHGKEHWLSLPFVFARGEFALLWMACVSLFYVYHSLRPELGLLAERGAARPTGLAARLTQGWQGFAAESARSHSILSRFTPVLLLSYGLFYTLLAFDLVMSLDPHWYSTLFGWRYFVITFYAGIATLVILGALLHKSVPGLRQQLTSVQFHDIGKLLFGFCLLSGGLFFTEYLVIWYGNLPEETVYVLARLHSDPWWPISWTVVVLLYFGPLVVLMSRRLKQKPGSLMPIAAVILAALWVDRFLAVAPSVWKEPSVPLGPVEIGATIGFVAGVLLVWSSAARHVPLVPLIPVQPPAAESVAHPEAGPAASHT